MRSKNALKNIISSLLLQFITITCGFIVPRMIIKNFGSNVNGLVSSITQFLAYITLLESGIGPVIKATLYKPIAEKNEKQIASILKASEKFFRMIAIIFIGYLIGLTVILPILMSEEFDVLYTISLILIISVSTFAEYYFGMTYKLYLQAEQRTYITSNIQICATIINTLLIIILIKFGYSIQVVKLISSFIFVLKPIAQNIYVKRKYKINYENADINYKLEQKWDGLAQHIASIVHGNTDVTVLTIFASITDVSIYAVYAMVVNGVKKIVESLTRRYWCNFW